MMLTKNIYNINIYSPISLYFCKKANECLQIKSYTKYLYKTSWYIC